MHNLLLETKKASMRYEMVYKVSLYVLLRYVKVNSKERNGQGTKYFLPGYDTGIMKWLGNKMTIIQINTMIKASTDVLDISVSV